MKVNLMQDLLISIIRSELTGTGLSEIEKHEITPELIPDLYKLAKSQDAAHFLYPCFSSNGLLKLLDEDMTNALQDEEILAVYRYEQINYAFAQICTAFEKENLSYMPLKGSVIRPFYPDESMRTSCDIDILVHEEDFERACACLEATGCRKGRLNYHDISFFSAANIHIELHFNICENIDSLDAVLRRVWEYAEPDGGCRYKMKKEFFMYHILAHMAFHVSNGGCGIKPLMDLWVMDNKMDLKVSDAKKLLEEAGLYRFACVMEELSAVWFSGKEHTSQTLAVQEYIMSAGTYGTFENSVAIRQSKKGGSNLKFFLGRIFVPYSRLKATYPVLEKCPILFPVLEVARWFRIFRKNKFRTSVYELSLLRNVSDDKKNKIEKMLSDLGLNEI